MSTNNSGRVSLLARDVGKSYAGRMVLDAIDLTVGSGHRLGLVGENGVGKSTLLRLLAGVERPDAGTVHAPDDLAYLPQDPAFAGEDTVGDVLREALAPLQHAVREVERLSTELTAEVGRSARSPGHPAPTSRVKEESTADRFVLMLQWAQDHDAWDADRRADLAARRLGLAELPPDRPVGTLSGGERTRLALVAIITRRPDCVLLDEPTNHLDDESMDLLEGYLVDLPGIVVAASHDRVFLDRVCTEIVDLDPSPMGTDGRGGRRYSFGASGNYSGYLASKADTRRRYEQTYRTQQQQIDELRQATKIDTGRIAHDRGPRDNDKFIYAFKGASVQRAVARRVHNAERRLASAERTALRRPPEVLSFSSPLTPRLTSRPTSGTGSDSTAEHHDNAVQIRNLEVDGRVSVPRLDVPTGGRLLVTGANGSGKSSLLAVIDGRLKPDRGTVGVHARRAGTLPQDVTFADPSVPADRVFAAGLAAAGRPDVDPQRALHDLGLLLARDARQPVGLLSVGQRRRLALAILVATEPDLLLLDEPTNHISLSLASELEEALRSPAGESQGTVIVASHDRWLRRRWDGQELPMSLASSSACQSAG